MLTAKTHDREPTSDPGCANRVSKLMLCRYAIYGALSSDGLSEIIPGSGGATSDCEVTADNVEISLGGHVRTRCIRTHTVENLPVLVCLPLGPSRAHEESPLRLQIGFEGILKRALPSTCSSFLTWDDTTASEWR